MARKKNKAAKSSPSAFHSVPPVETGGLSAGLLPALGALTLVGAWLAALGGFSDGTAHIRTFINIDSVRPQIFFRELFHWDAPLSSLAQGPAPYYFPDLAIQWAMFALGAGAALALCLYPLALAAASACGWILLCDRLHGKSPVRRAAVLALHAPPFLFLAWDNADIFRALMEGVIHYGVVAALPWLLWLSLLILDSGGGRKSAAVPAKPAVALAVLLAALAASDLLVVPQFAAPMALCAVVLAAKGALSPRKCLVFIALLAAGTIVGKVLAEAPGIICGMSAACEGVGLNWAAFPRGLALLLAHFGNAAARSPLAAAMWLAFAAIAAWRAASVLWPSLRRSVPAALAVPAGASHSLTALFVPAAMAAAFAAPAATGGVSDSFSYMHPAAAPYEGALFSLRYSLPVIYLPLFVGWALLPGGIPRFGGRRAAVAACAALLALSAPKAARIDFAELDPFASPFQQCFAQNAKRLDWRGGIATMLFARLPLVHSGAEIERLLPVGVFRRPGAGQSFMVVEYSFSHRALSGEFDFVVANLHNGRLFRAPPRAGETGCAAGDPQSCPVPVDNLALDADVARAAFGEPKEVIDCAGVGLLHYDPPLKFDFSHLENPYLAPVARW